ncbi:hypothetical protein BD626DRAFT_567700 [Schizophyllum amplum]|uniref:Uncharacterized protein n=1 Tax=Schizophyllum amplum TaxID=97359 RepID=A0A550CJ48_9AGAR|nr:hypothetical protein BD626DRAFT_567700 [Auriculariopsis ampla]
MSAPSTSSSQQPQTSSGMTAPPHGVYEGSQSQHEHYISFVPPTMSLSSPSSAVPPSGLFPPSTLPVPHDLQAHETQQQQQVASQGVPAASATTNAIVSASQTTPHATHENWLDGWLTPASTYPLNERVQMPNVCDVDPWDYLSQQQAPECTTSPSTALLSPPTRLRHPSEYGPTPSQYDLFPGPITASDPLDVWNNVEAALWNSATTSFFDIALPQQEMLHRPPATPACGPAPTWGTPGVDQTGFSNALHSMLDRASWGAPDISAEELSAFGCFPSISDAMFDRHMSDHTTHGPAWSADSGLDAHHAQDSMDSSEGSPSAPEPYTPQAYNWDLGRGDNDQ